MTILNFFNVGNPVFLVSRKQVRPPARSKLVLVQDERFEADWDRLVDWAGAPASPLEIMTAFDLQGLWAGTFAWADQPQPEFAVSALFLEHFNTGWIGTNVAPVNALVVSGTAALDQTLTADVSGLVDTDGLPASNTYAYQWQWETSPDVFEDIAGETGTTYLVTRYTMGKRVRFRLQYQDLLLNDETLYSVATAVVPVVDIPVEGAPTIQNLTSAGQPAQQGHALSAVTTAIFDFNTIASAFSYQWLRETAVGSDTYVEIDGSTAQTHTVVAEDINADPAQRRKLKVRVSYTDGLGKVESVESAAGYETVDSAFSGTPTITSSTAVFDVGTVLTANVSALQDANDPLTYEYQWYAEVFGSPGTFLAVSGATDSVFNVTSDYQKRKLYLEVTTIDALGNRHTRQTTQTTRVNSLPEGAPYITGTFQVGQTLSANTSQVSDYDTIGTKYYQWFVKDPNAGDVWVSAQNNSTTATYVVKASDINKQVKVRLSYMDTLGKAEQVDSDSILIVNTAPTGVPTISVNGGGNAEVGKTLSAVVSGIADVNTVPGGTGAYLYQWFIKDPFGANTYAPIAGATSSTYLVQYEDVSQDIKVEVSFTDLGGVLETVVSTALRVANSLPTGDLSLILSEGGDPEVGKTLIADPSGVSDVNGLGAFSYQWYRSDIYKGGSTNSAIAGATSATYVIPAEDEGYELYVRGTVTDLDPRDPQTYTLSTQGYLPPFDNLLVHLDSASFSSYRSGNTIYDLSGNGYNAIRSGDLGFESSTKRVLFDASGDYATLPYAALADLGQSFTISLLARDYDANMTYFSTRDVTTNDSATKGFAIYKENGVLKTLGGVGAWTWSDKMVTGPNIGTGNYYLINVSKDSSGNVCFYVNGVKTLGNRNVGSIYQTDINPNSVRIAGYNHATRPSYGSVSHRMDLGYFSIHKRVLTDNEIAAMYAGLAPRFAPSVSRSIFIPVKADFSGQPVITGRATTLAILTADTSSIADGNGLGTFAYQWKVDGVNVGSNSATYTVQASDFQKNITVTVSFDDRAGYSNTVTSEPLFIGNNCPLGSVVIDGTPQVSYTLTANISGLSDADQIVPETITYQWLSGGVEVQNGASSTYTVVPTDYAKAIVVKVSYTDVLGFVETPDTYANLTSAARTIVNSPRTGAVYVVNAQNTQITQAQEQDVLYADVSALRDINIYDDQTPNSFTYSWQRNNVAVGTGQTYTPGFGDVGAVYKVVVSFTDDNGNVESTTSSNTVSIINSPPEGELVVTGESRVGKTLTANASGITDRNYYGSNNALTSGVSSTWHNLGTTWYHGINGSTMLVQGRPSSGTSSVTFSSSKTISQITLQSWGGYDAPELGYATLYANGGYVGTFRYAKLGQTQPGNSGATVTFSFTPRTASTWSIDFNNDAGWVGNQVNFRWGLVALVTQPTYTYRWYRNGSSITNAVSSSYVLQEADYNTNVTCKVFYSDAYGTSHDVTSSPLLIDAKGSPSITGTREVGATLTADTSAMQDVQGFAEYHYAWEAKLVGESNFSAVGSDQATFVVPEGYEAATLRVTVSYVDSEGNAQVAPTSSVVYIRSDVVGTIDLVGRDPSAYYVGDVVIAEHALTDASGLPASTSISYAWKRDGTTVQTRASELIYETPINITNAGSSALSNHHVEVVLNTQSLISANKMNSDSRVHFYDANGNPIPYWFEGPTNHPKSVYWMKLDLPVGTTTITARYSKNASFSAYEGSASSMGFLFFDGFDNLDNWTLEGSSSSMYLSGGDLRGASTAGYLKSAATYDSPVIARAVLTIPDSPINGITSLGFVGQLYNTDKVGILDHSGYSYYYQYQNSSNASWIQFSFDGENEGVIKDEIVLTGTQARISRSRNNQEYTSGFFSVPSSPKAIMLGSRIDFQYLTQSYNASWHYVHVRPYVAGANVSVSAGTETSYYGSVYKLVAADSGRDIYTVLSYTDLQGYAESVSSPTITVSNSPATGSVVIDGSPYTGQTLTANTSGIVDLDGVNAASLTCQWFIDGAPIEGATALTYVVLSTQVTHTLTVAVGFADNTGASYFMTSPGRVVLDTPSTGEALLNGTAEVGQTLSVDVSPLADVDGGVQNITYQWYESPARSPFASEETLIAGATSADFVIPEGSENKEYKAIVSYEDGNGATYSQRVPNLPVIPEDDLEIFLDAASLRSYEYGIAVWNDLSPNGYQIPLYGNAWTSVAQGRFLGSAALSEGGALSSIGPDFTISGLVYVPSITGNNITSFNNILLGSLAGTLTVYQELNYFKVNWGTAYGTSVLRSNTSLVAQSYYLVNVVVTGSDTAAPRVELYVNAAQNKSLHPSTGLYSGMDTQPGYSLKTVAQEDFWIGQSNAIAAYSRNIGMFAFHRRALSEVEISAMYATYRDRLNASSQQRKIVQGLPSGLPTISGTPRAGSVLTANTAAISDPNGRASNYTYQWKADGVNISGATSSTYTLTANEFNKQITVTATFTDRLGQSHTLESAPVLVENTPATGTVTISGTPEVNQTLTAVTSGLQDANGLPAASSMTYQWYVDGQDALESRYYKKATAVDQWSSGSSYQRIFTGSRDGTKLFVSGDNEVRVFSTTDNTYLYSLSNSGNNFRQVSSNGDGSVVVGCHDTGNGFVKVYVNQNLAHTLTGPFANSYFGRAVSINAAGDIIAVGQPEPNATKVIIYSFNGSAWVEDAVISNAASWFGQAVALNAAGDKLVVAASSNTFVYEKQGGSWVLAATLSAGGEFVEWNGVDTIVIRYSVFRKVGEVWTRFAINQNSNFASVSSDGNTFVTGESGQSTVYLYQLFDNQPYLQAVITNGVARFGAAGVVLSPDNYLFATTDANSGAQIYRYLVGADRSKYLVSSADVSKDVQVEVSFTDNQGNAEGPFTSAPVTIVNSLPTGTFEIQGDLTEGGLAFVDVSGIDDPNGVGNDWSYQWLRDGVAIPGATSSDYTLTGADLFRLGLVSSFTDLAGTREHLSDEVLFTGLYKSEYPTTNSYSGIEEVVGDLNNLRQASGRVDSSNVSTSAWTTSGSETKVVELVGYLKATTTGTYYFSNSGVHATWAGAAAISAPSYSTITTSLSVVAGEYFPIRALVLSQNAAQDNTSISVGSMTASKNSSMTQGVATRSFYVPAQVQASYINFAMSVSADFTGSTWVYLTAPDGSNINIYRSGSYYNSAVFPNKWIEGTWTVSLVITYNGSGSVNNMTFGAVASPGIWAYALPNRSSSTGAGDYYGGLAAHSSWQEQAALSGTATISGVPQQGQSLSVLKQGDWASETGFVYQWKRNGTDIFGATGATYTVQAIDVGASLSVHVGLVSGSGAVAQATSASVNVVNSPPVGNLLISGETYAGQTLTATVSFSDANGIDNATLAYQWYADGVAIPDATASTHVVAEALGTALSVTASYQDNLGNPESVTSSAVAVTSAPPTGSVTIAGTYRVGQVLTATVDVSDADGIQEGTTVYQWMRNGVDIADATALSYTLVDADIGQSVAMEVRYTDNLGEQEALASAAAVVFGYPVVVANPLADQDTYAGLAVSFAVPADAFSDPDGGALTYAASGMPAWLAFDAATRTFSGTPSADDVGVSTITVTATDSDADSASDAFDMTVHARVTESFEFDGDDRWPGTLPEAEPTPGFNYSSASTSFDPSSGWPAPPVISGSASLTVEENIDAATVLETYTADKVVTWSKAGTDAAAFSLDAASGELRFVQSPDFETKSSYALTIVATDASGNVSTQAVSVSVTDVLE